MSPRNKVNPRRRPATAADVARAKKDAVHEATCAALVILFMDRSDSINQGYCNLSDLRDTLAQEDGIYIR